MSAPVVRPLLVRWIDAYGCGRDEWEAIEDIPPANAEVVTVGSFIREDENFLWLALSLSIDPHCINGRITIPKVLIIERRDLT